MSGSPNKPVSLKRTVLMPVSDLIDVYVVNALESIMCGPDVAREFLRGDRSARSIAEKAWELAVATLDVRNERYRPDDLQELI